ncbi:hypothetical protein C8R46DRAFT_241229 [Mycena filopes]|nr:hypothetical protein C8R46DRAFT_241229 [Mycena filopes]
MDRDDQDISNTGSVHSEHTEFTPHGGGIFPNAHHFTVAGGTFTNTTNNYMAPPTVPADFRMIPWGDIDLQRELLVNKASGAIGYQHERNCVRRVYSAKVDGRTSDMTVAVYQGDGAGEDWRQDVETYTSMRSVPERVTGIFTPQSFTAVRKLIFTVLD